MASLSDADIVDIDDVRMRNARRRFRLPLKTRDKFRIVLILLMENLNGDGTLQKLVLCSIDICHAPAAH